VLALGLSPLLSLNQGERTRDTTVPYDTQFKEYRIKVNSPVDDKHQDVLLLLIRQAWEQFGKA
jgi:hypothetical protein